MSHSPDLLEAPSRSAGRAPALAGSGSSVPCIYCRGPIPASAFAFWSNAKRLLSAICPECDRRVTLATSTWRRWLKQSVA